MKNRLWTTNAEAIAWVTLATALFSLIFSSGKFAGDSASVFEINFLRNIGGLVTLLAMVAANGFDLRQYRSRRPLSHLARALFGVIGALAIIQSSADMPIVDATALSLLYVVFVIVLGMAVFGERIGRRQSIGILLCGAGALGIMAARGAFSTFDPAYVWPAALAVFGAMLFAFEAILIKVLAQADRPMTVMLYVNVYGLLILVVPALLSWKSLPAAEMVGYLMLGPMGVAAQYCVIRGYRMADISVVGPVDYAWLIFASLIGYFAFGEIPTYGVVAGSALIAFGGLVLATVKPAPDKHPITEFQ